MNEICFLDKRTNLFNNVHFEQTDIRVVFLTKAKGKCSPECTIGDMLINVMEIDPYSSPMKFTIHTSPYEACMGGGVRNDLIIRSFVINAISDRGYDIVLACQYNDCVIFDCVTSTRQEPIKVPQFSSDSSDFVDLEVSKTGTMVKVPMIMDKSGALYWLHWVKDKEVGVLRHNPKLQMGNS
jgi:hypothetical protein